MTNEVTPRLVAVFSSARADLWPLRAVIQRLRSDPRTAVLLIASGTHASDRSALDRLGLDSTELTIVADGCPRDDSPMELVAAASRGGVGVSLALGLHRPDLLLVLGDRYELLPAAMAALVYGVPIAHLHGGEITEGAIDDSIRHAMTKMAHLHFCSTERAAARVRALGEEPWRVHVSGAPALDGLNELAAASPRDALEKLAGIPLARPLGLLTYHPVTLHPTVQEAELEALITAADRLGSVIATHPGADPGASSILRRLERWQKERRNVALVPSLGALYPAALATVDVVLGNSSSGIIEAPSLGVPVVNIGDRQKGRERWPGTIDVQPGGQAVQEALERALDPAFREVIQTHPNPYGDGHAAERIIDVMATIEWDDLMVKRLQED